MEENNEKEYEVLDPTIQINDLWNGLTEAVDYFTIMLEELIKYPFWKVEAIKRKDDFIVYYLNGNTTEVKVKYTDNKEILPHIIHLLHQTIASYLKKRRTIKTRTRTNFLASKSTLVIEIRTNK